MFFSGALQASAEDFWMLFQNHRVTLIARDVPVSRILDQWARIGGTTIVHADAVSGGPVTLRLIDVPEREALETLLRGVDGYIIAERDDALNNQSDIDRILILPRTPGGTVVNQASTSPPAMQTIEQTGNSDVQPADVNVQPDSPGVARVTRVGGMPAVVPPVLPPGTFVGVGTISPGPGQPPQTVPMLFRQGTAATGRPGETPAPVPITQLSPGPEPR